MHLVAELGYDFASLYIGGGTPTIRSRTRQDHRPGQALFPGILEVSAETSPNHLTDEMCEVLDGRVQRLSCGVQSFDDRLLRQMDRYGSTAPARKSSSVSRGCRASSRRSTST